MTKATADYTKQSEGSIKNSTKFVSIVTKKYLCLDMAIIKQGLVIAKVDYATKLSGNISIHLKLC